MLLLALLIADVAPQDRKAFPGGEDDGTRTIAAERHCDPAAQDEEVCVTANPNRFRLEKIEPRYVEAPVRAASRLGPGEISAEAEHRALPGAAGPAAMVRFRIPLGRKKPK